MKLVCVASPLSTQH